MKKIFTNGVFDLFHEGHYKLLEKAKSYGDWLIVGVCSDESCEKYKRKPFQNWETRAKTIEQLPFVDEVLKTPWARDMDENFYIDQKINLHVQGDDGNASFKLAEELGILKILGRTDNISTSKILEIINIGSHNTENKKANSPIKIPFENEFYYLKYNTALLKNEYNSIAAFRFFLNKKNFIVKPVCYDENKNILLLQSAPENAGTLQNVLNTGYVNVDLLENIMVSLASMHVATWKNKRLANRFKAVYRHQEIEKVFTLHNTTPNALLQQQINQFIKESNRIQLALIHGDFCTKNILVWGDEYLFIDFIQSTYGDPAIDAGKFIANIYINYFVTGNVEFSDAAKNLITTYSNNNPFVDNKLFERIQKYCGIFILMAINNNKIKVLSPDHNKEIIHFAETTFVTGKISNKKIDAIFSDRHESAKTV